MAKQAVGSGRHRRTCVLALYPSGTGKPVPPNNVVRGVDAPLTPGSHEQLWQIVVTPTTDFEHPGRCFGSDDVGRVAYPGARQEDRPEWTEEARYVVPASQLLYRVSSVRLTSLLWVLLEKRIGHIEGCTDGDVGSLHVLPDQSARESIAARRSSAN
jgi:hypothetical protein